MEAIPVNADRIEREIVIEAPIERVWSALTEPSSVSAWFCNGAETSIDLRPGGVMTLNHGEHGYYLTTIVDVDAPHRFSYRWASAYPNVQATEANSTLVEFTLEATTGGTVLRLVESGFDALVIPKERVAKAGYESHSGGWTEVVANFATYVMDNSDGAGAVS